MNEENLAKLKLALQTTKENFDHKKLLLNDISDNNQNLIKQLEFEKKDLLNRFKEKEKESNI